MAPLENIDERSVALKSRCALDSQQRPLEISTIQSADDILKQADALTRHNSHADVMQAAHYYLTAAYFLEYLDPPRSVEAFHKAGQQLHSLQQFMDAGRAFSNAGRVTEQATEAMSAGPDQHHLQHLAVRAYSQANNSLPMPASWTLQKRNA